MFPSPPLKIAGVGRYIPKRVVTNYELEVQCNLPEGWIAQRQGVHKRHWVKDETTSFMAVKASREALINASLESTDIDLIINASTIPEQLIPDTAPLIQRQLGLNELGIPGFSIHATCLSFLVSLDISATLIATGRYKNILIVSSEISSIGLKFSDPKTCTLFGDGAAAAVVTHASAEEESRVNAVRFETHGDGAYYTEVRGCGSRKPPNNKDTRPEDNLFSMKGSKVFRMAKKYRSKFLENLRPGLSTGLGDIQMVIPHQASKLALDSHRTCGMPNEKVMRTIDQFGNCISASIPITLYEAIDKKRIKRGDKLLFLGTGAGLSLGGIILTY